MYKSGLFAPSVTKIAERRMMKLVSPTKIFHTDRPNLTTGGLAMKLWLVYILITVFFWGLIGFFSKLATRTLNTPDILLASAIERQLQWVASGGYKRHNIYKIFIQLISVKLTQHMTIPIRFYHCVWK
jgi:hypothetical protein